MAHGPFVSPEFIGGVARSIVTTSDVPLVLLSETLVVIAASESFCTSYGIDVTDGLALSALGNGEWDVPQLNGLLMATATSPVAVKNYHMDLVLPGRPAMNLVVNAHRLEATAEVPIMVLLSVQDGTENRKRAALNDKLVREKTVMLAELQHRVANSLQIIASVLLQSARRMQSPDTKAHIVDAHNRVMSVAALQHQLAISPDEAVDMRVYLANLCRSIGASMIRDRDTMRIDADVHESFVPAEISLSLGLIVTELLINSLKHAYPYQSGGVIVVKFRSGPEGWVLSVADDGIGMPVPASDAVAGLGTGIVRALVAQVDAEIEMVDANPGTLVVIRHVTARETDQPIREVAV